MFRQAKWIWYEETGTKNSFGEFYGEFTVENSPLLRISCDGDYTLYIDGKYVSSNQYGDFEHYKSVDEIDLSELSKGTHSLGILVWHFGKDSQRYKKYTPGVICEITDRDTVCFATDENTLCRQSKAYISGFEREISSQLGFSYAYDSTKEDLWTFGKGENMKKAHPVDKKCDFVPRPNKKLQLVEFVNATKIGENLYDLGKEYVGLLSFEIDATENTLVNISYGECLENGQVKRKIGGRDFSINYVAKCGKNEYTNYMLRFACRYLEVHSEKGINVQKIGLIPQFYPVTEKGTALSGTEKEIYDICVNTLKLCMMEHYVDCPWREQCLYAFDSRNQMLSGYYAFEGGNFGYVKSNLILMSKDRRNDGLMSICYPCGNDLTIPSFSLYYILSVKEYLEHSGDVDIIKQVNPKMLEIINAFLNNMEKGLVCRFSGENHWNFYDWSPHAEGAIFQNEKKEPDVLISILTVLALESYKAICDRCHLPFELNIDIKELKSSIKEAFFDTGSGLFHVNGNYTELVNALAVRVGLLSQSEAQAVCHALASNKLIPCSLSMKCFVYDALINTDKDLYRQFILEDIQKTYSPMIETGTVWETKEGATAFGNAGSLCHGWSSIPVFYYAKLR